MTKGLEALERIIETFYDKESEDIKAIDKELIALEIIKITRVDTNLIKLSENYDDYCFLEAEKLLTLEYHNLTAKQQGITEEQYNLLKEVLL